MALPHYATQHGKGLKPIIHRACYLRLSINWSLRICAALPIGSMLIDRYKRPNINIFVIPDLFFCVFIKMRTQRTNAAKKGFLVNPAKAGAGVATTAAMARGEVSNFANKAFKTGTKPDASSTEPQAPVKLNSPGGAGVNGVSGEGTGMGAGTAQARPASQDGRDDDWTEA